MISAITDMFVSSVRFILFRLILDDTDSSCALISIGIEFDIIRAACDEIVLKLLIVVISLIRCTDLSFARHHFNLVASTQTGTAYTNIGPIIPCRSQGKIEYVQLLCRHILGPCLSLERK